MGPSIHKKKKNQVSRLARGKSPKLASCRHDQSVFFCVQQCPCNTRYFSFFFIYIANAADGENFRIFPPVKNCKKISLSSERNPITLDEIIIKTVQHAKAEIGPFFSEWTRSLIHRSASMNQRGVSDEHANRCKRKSSSCMRRLSKYKQKLFMH